MEGTSRPLKTAKAKTIPLVFNRKTMQPQQLTEPMVTNLLA